MLKQKQVMVFMFSLLTFAGLVANAQSDRCAALKSISVSDVRIDLAELIPAGPVPPNKVPYLPPYPKDWQLPSYCQVRGISHARKGFDGAQYGNNFELRLPAAWNGKLLFQGGGGTDGVVSPALGIVNNKDLPALARGYAVVSTDSGHSGVLDFAHEQQARLDYAYNAIGEVVRAAKQILAAYYQKPAEHTYYMGCSNGGRDAMMAVQRDPLEFDGAIAGDPGFDLSHAAIAEAWDTESFLAAAPRDEQNRPILAKSLTADDLKLVVKAVLDKCDDLDGLRDGQINDIAACHFDPESLLCAGAKTPQCLSRMQVDALKRSFGGAHDSKGAPLYSSWPYDAGIAEMGWRMWKLGTSENAQANALNVIFGAQTLKEYFVHPYIPTLDPAHLDYDAIAGQVAATSAINDATSTDLSTFVAKGGKLILYQGMSDPAFSANDLIAYYNRLAADNGGMDQARSSARLFLIPGMNHCNGGPSTDQFDVLNALDRWVENGIAPEKIIAWGSAFPGRTRPLCPYPQYAAYKGSGDPEDAANFTCK